MPIKPIINGSEGKSVEKPFGKVYSVENGILAKSKKNNFLKSTKAK